MTDQTTSIPRIAIVGRPNVGKSSIMNMLAKAKVSIVDPTPGVTRDRVTFMVELQGPLLTEEPRLVEIIDTGGYGVYTADGARFDDAGEDLQKLTAQIEGQIGAAIDQADAILFIIDAQVGITALDETIAKLLRERALGGKDQRKIPITVVANKVDAENWEAHGLEAAAMGFGEPLLLSAKTNYMRRVFCEHLFEMLPELSPEEREEASPVMKLALVGRRNAGKSTFVNALAGEERCIVSEIAGTTRDAIDVRFEIDGRTCMAIDTAGVRKKTRFADQVEWFAFHRCKLAIGRADVVLFLIDATENVTGIDKRLGAQIAEQYKPCVIVVNKWDLTEGRKNRKGKPITPQDYQEYIEKELPGLSYAPIVFTSAEHGEGLTDTVNVAFDLFEQARERVSTGKLNNLIKAILSERGPSTRLGSQAKVYFASQVAVEPPTIVFAVNKPDLFTDTYQRYFLNRFRETLPFSEIPIRLIFRPRRRADLNELLSGEHARKRREQGLAKRKGQVEVEGIDITELDDPEL